MGPSLAGFLRWGKRVSVCTWRTDDDPSSLSGAGVADAACLTGRRLLTVLRRLGDGSPRVSGVGKAMPLTPSVSILVAFGLLMLS